MRAEFDVIVVGGGPAGTFCALHLVENARLRVLIVEKGSDLEERRATRRSLVSGWGGAGAFSDGKLTLSPDVGGWLEEYVGRERLTALIEQVDAAYRRFGAPDHIYGTDEELLKEFRQRAARAELTLIAPRVKHIGTERCPLVAEHMRQALLDSGALIRTNTEVQEILVEDGVVRGVRLAGGQPIYAAFVVVAPGREGAGWLRGEAERLGLALATNPVDVGVRVETSAATMEDLTEAFYEAKLLYYSPSFDDRVRTFCMCPNGEVITERIPLGGEGAWDNSAVITVNGHSYSDRRTENTNFALLVSKSFTEPFKEPILYGQYLARLSNLLGGGVLVQRLGDLRDGRRSTPERIKRGLVQPTLTSATPGDLSAVLPYRHLTSILEMLQAMEAVAPGINARHTLLYGVEVKFYSSRLRFTSALETEIKNLFGAGDGAGVTRGLVQASCSGLIVAEQIAARGSGTLGSDKG